VEKTSYAKTLKELLVPIAENYKNMYLQNDKKAQKLKDVELLNYLKDEYKETPILNNMTMRELLQTFGTDILRETYDDIHIIFKALEMVEETNKKYIISDMRFENEFLLGVNLNIRKSVEEKKIFLINYLQKVNEITTEDLLRLKHLISEKLNIKEAAFNKGTIVEVIYSNIIKKIEECKTKANKYKPQKDEIEVLTIEILKEELKETIDWQEIYKKYGVMNIFRPIINPQNNTDYKNEEQLIQSIISYTNFTKAEVNSVKSFYEQTLGKGSFTLENIKKYGFQRAHFGHISETQLRGLVPHSYINYPFGSEDSKNEQLKLSSIILEETGDTILAFLGSAGAGKDFLVEKIISILNTKKSNHKKETKKNKK